MGASTGRQALGLLVTIFLGLTLSGCAVPNSPASVPGVGPSGAGPHLPLSSEQVANRFVEVVRAVQPVAERECRKRTAAVNCDFLIAVDDNRRAPPNAFQTVNDDGRPVITFTPAMIASVENADELAFVLSHEAAHHIAGHLSRQARYAAEGAEVFGGLATLTGGGAKEIATAQELGAAVGARSYSQAFELEADRLGTIIAHQAGYDPLKGAQFFVRIPEPGNRFLGSHPPNSERIEIVRSTSRQLGLVP